MLWIARDKYGADTRYWLFSDEPHKGGDGSWRVRGFEAPMPILPSESPTKLKPGKGPVRVRLAVVEKEDER